MYLYHLITNLIEKLSGILIISGIVGYVFNIFGLTDFSSEYLNTVIGWGILLFIFGMVWVMPYVIYIVGKILIKGIKKFFQKTN